MFYLIKIPSIILFSRPYCLDISDLQWHEAQTISSGTWHVVEEQEAAWPHQFFPGNHPCHRLGSDDVTNLLQFLVPQSLCHAASQCKLYPWSCRSSQHILDGLERRSSLSSRYNCLCADGYNCLDLNSFCWRVSELVRVAVYTFQSQLLCPSSYCSSCVYHGCSRLVQSWVCWDTEINNFLKYNSSASCSVPEVHIHVSTSKRLH